MTEQPKRGLRPKRPPRYRASDEQDPDNPSHTRPNYAKISSASHTHEYVSPTVMLNQTAKILVKFINKSNKSIFMFKEDLRDMRQMKEQSEKEQAKKQTIPKDKMSLQSHQPSKKPPATSRNQKTQPPKKKIQLYNFKGLHQIGKPLKFNPQDQIALKGYKNIESLSELINSISPNGACSGVYSGPVNSQLSQLRSLYPNLKDFNYQTLTQSPNPNLFEFNPPSASQVSAKAKVSQTQSVIPPAQQKAPNEPVKQTVKQSKSQKKVQQGHNDHQKIFKRSAYHVAIAYHIYLKGLYEQGITSGNLIDPTYKARVIKEQSGFKE